MASPSGGSGDGGPPAKKMFALFQPGVRDTTSSANANAAPADSSSSSATPGSSTNKRSARPRAAKDKPVKYSFAPVDLTAEDEGSANGQPEASTSGNKPKRQRRNSPPAAPPTPAPAPYLPPLTLNVKGTGVKSDQPTHSFFAKRTLKEALAGDPSETRAPGDPQQRIKRSKIPPSLPLFPTAESQHVRRLSTTTDELQSSLCSLVLPFEQTPIRSSKGKGKQRDTNEDPSLPQSGLTQQVRASTHHNPRPCPHRADAQTIAQDLAQLARTSPHAQISAFQAIILSSTGASNKSHSLWTHRWRPRRADQVLANTEAATYLSSWLRVLQITSKKSDIAGDAQPSRKTFRRGGPVYRSDTSSDSEAALDAEDAELVAFFNQFNSRSAKSSSRRRPSTVFDDEDDAEDGGDGILPPQAPSTPAQPALDFDPTHDLSNAILLTGPSGSCKTAAVYACAEELGYEVFELYPGMGRRSKADLQSAVGDLGRNHMVSSGGGSAGGSSAFSAMMKASSAQQTQQRQSLILIEEVDVLSRDDVTFWAGVRDLVNTSRRPVVMTCNDVDFVPLDDLVLQEVLNFKRAPRDVALEYLRFVAAAEGCGIVDAAGCVGNSDDDGGIDLRQAINQLQFAGGAWSAVAATQQAPEVIESRPTSEATDPQAQLAVLRHTSKLLSRLSAHTSTLARPHVRQAGIDDPTQREPGPDDLVLPSHWRALYAQAAEDEAKVVLPSSGKEDEMCEEYERLVRSVGVAEGIGEMFASTSERDFKRDLTTQVGHLWTILDPQLRSVKDQYASLVSLRNATPPRLSSHANMALHYAPSLRHIISIEDFEEAMYILDLHQRKALFLQDLQQASNGRGRMTRNSTGFLQNFTRVYDFEKEVLQAARRSGSAFLCARREFYKREDHEQETARPPTGAAAVVGEVLAGIVAPDDDANATALPASVPGEARKEIEAKLGCE